LRDSRGNLRSILVSWFRAQNGLKGHHESHEIRLGFSRVQAWETLISDISIWIRNRGLFWRFFLEAEEALWDGNGSQEQVDRD